MKDCSASGSRPKDSGYKGQVSGAAAPREGSDPNRAVRIAGGVASTNPHDCEDDRIASTIGNEIRSVT
jgi:hypothetical protein